MLKMYRRQRGSALPPGEGCSSAGASSRHWSTKRLPPPEHTMSTRAQPWPADGPGTDDPPASTDGVPVRPHPSPANAAKCSAAVNAKLSPAACQGLYEKPRKPDAEPKADASLAQGRRRPSAHRQEEAAGQPVRSEGLLAPVRSEAIRQKGIGQAPPKHPCSPRKPRTEPAT